MSSKTKIIVLRMKEIIYTAIFVALGIFLITLLVIMFRPKKSSNSPSAAGASSQNVISGSSTLSFTPGVYSSSIILGNQEINVEVTVDSDHINSIHMVPLSETVTTMYPLMQPVFEDLSTQICKDQSTDNLSYSAETRYTSSVIIQAIDLALKKAEK